MSYSVGFGERMGLKVSEVAMKSKQHIGKLSVEKYANIAGNIRVSGNSACKVVTKSCHLYTYLKQ